jgi:hypothetical protein
MQAAVCKYSHDYILTSEQLASLASNAKKAPCNWLKNGVRCGQISGDILNQSVFQVYTVLMGRNVAGDMYVPMDQHVSI